MSHLNKFFLFALLALFKFARSENCVGPQVSFNSFTTRDATIVTNIAYISEFSVKCTTGSLSSLYVDIQGAILPVSQVGQSKYQVSWIEDVKSARRGDLTLRLFDEDRYTAVKKALRTGEDASTVDPFFTVTVNHPGAFYGPWLKSEFLATLLSCVVAYLALNSRAKLLS